METAQEIAFNATTDTTLRSRFESVLLSACVMGWFIDQSRDSARLRDRRQGCLWWLMKYEIEAMPVGVFSSRLELHWFCFLRQHSERVKYVGHVERWRDFVFKDQSIEIKPFFTEEVLNEVARDRHKTACCFWRVEIQTLQRFTRL